ncbi:MAG TPA: glycoside hydrolase family 15 protein [Acidimicrobiales bacterium]|nr:glycoside hydrolase family 15 protein [Acidimicrobiales bacterium]
MRNRVRENGFAAIADYAVVGDGRSVALLAADGRVDWWPCPTLDAPPVCASIVDVDRGGVFELSPVGDYEIDRHYLCRTNVLESICRTSHGLVGVTQGFNVGSSGRLPWVEFVHRCVVLSGQVTMHWVWRPGDRFGQATPWITSHHGMPLSVVGDQVIGVLTEDATECSVDHDRRAMRGTFTIERGERRTIALVAADNEPLFLPDLDAVNERLDRTMAYWCQWSERLAHAGAWAPAVERSALALKLLLAEDTGAIAAAATTSLPERIGGDKNWDYRFAWVRDSSFTLDALINLGLHEEVQRCVSWLIDAIKRNGPGLHVFYTLEGEITSTEEDLSATGYKNSQPVLAGNRAAGQCQLGTYGDLFDTVFRYCAEGHVLDVHTARLLSDLADRCCDDWRKPDAGIWELTSPEHYTISKIGCWVALDRAARLVDLGQIADLRGARWREEADSVRSWIETNCWSGAKRSYTFYAGTEDLDAAVLLAARTGFDRGHRLRTSIRAIRDELGVGPLLYRYSGAKVEEGAFVACSFWAVEALALTGQCEEATDLMDEAVKLVNDVGLLAEEIDVESHAFLGNFPQGLSHLSLINAAFTLHNRTNDQTPWTRRST